MRIIIDQNGISPESDVGQGFRTLKNLTFAPETGLLGQSAPINEITAEIITGTDIEAGDYMRLRDDLENLWAQYWLMSARRVDHQTLRVVGQSDLLLLDRPRLPATFYDGATVASIVREIFAAVDYTFTGTPYTLDAAIGAQTLTGFCPEQTARERLQWVCFAAGAYIRTYFCTGVHILPVPGAASGVFGTVIPIEKTFWKPTITETDYVTAVSARAYTFTRAEPQSGEQYVTDQGGVTYVYTTEDIRVSNPDLQPAQFPANEISAQDVMLLDRARASAVASRLAGYYFKRTTVQADVINNGEYMPGQLVSVYGDADRMYTGYITACAFRFGTQARATLTIAAAALTPSAALIVIAVFGDEILSERRYTFPVGYGYSLTNDFIDLDRDGLRRVFRPLTETTEGTLPAEGDVAYVNYAVALRLDGSVLEVISVDALDAEEGVVTIS